MKHRLFRNRYAGAAALTMATLAGALTLTGGTASAFSDPSYGTAPQFYNGNVGQIIRSAGSDTTYYMQQSISDLFNGAALYGCNVNDPVDFPCPTGADTATTDNADNWDRTEALVGADEIGSGAGQLQLCGKSASPQPVDMSRSSKKPGNKCAQQDVNAGYAFDGVPTVDFTNVNPAVYGPIKNTSTPYYTAVHTSANESAQNGTDSCVFTSFPSPSCDLMGPVADGWVPGNNVNGPYTGTPFTNMTNTGGASSLAYELYCVSGGTQITDWGSLTNGGTSLGVPVRIMGVNPASGTTATYSGFVNSGQPANTSECDGATIGGSSLTDANLNAATFVSGPLTGQKEVALENNAAQIGDFLVSDYPHDPADQAAELASTLYFMSEGPLISNPASRQVTIYSNGDPATGTPQAYGVTKMKQNGVGASTITENNDTFPTARELFQLGLGYQLPAGDQNTAQSFSVTDDTFTSGSNQLTSANAKFQQSDIGLTVSGAGIPNGTYITAVAGPAGSQADLVNGAALPANTVELNQPTTAANTASETVTFGGNNGIQNGGHVVGIRASVIDYFNWMCSTNGDGILTKGKDLVTGLNYDTELTNLIDNTYGFNRITDLYTGFWASQFTCGLIYPQVAAHQTVADGASTIGNPYNSTNFPGISTSPAPATQPLPLVTSGTYNGLAGAITFPDS